jgi:glycosyltransferase involved in cell wall biosynthesis
MKISVCMATFNGGKYLRKQIYSILKQLSVNDELIISDDGSTDETIEIIKSFIDCRVLLLHHVKDNNLEKVKHSHYLVSSNFENALKHVKGDFIFLSDQDDIWVDNKVEVMVPYLLKYSLVMSNCFVINDDDVIVRESFFSLCKLPRGLLLNISKPIYHGCCIAFTKKVLEEALPFPKKLILHDSWLGVVAESFGKVKFIDDQLMFYRRHNENASALEGKSTNSTLFKIRYRVVFFFQLIKKIFQIKLQILPVTKQ